MRKIIGSIIAVCLVQIGFQLYTVVERTNYSFPSISANVSTTQSQPLIADVEDAFQESAGIEAPFVARSEPHHAALRRPQTMSRALIARTSPKVLFPTIVINIPRQDPYEFTAYNAPAAIPTAQPESSAAKRPTAKIVEPKKKSILVKVVKKPYDFLKFVASKLN